MHLGGEKGEKSPPHENLENFYIIFTYSFYLIISKLRIKEKKEPKFPPSLNFPQKKILGTPLYPQLSQQISE